MSRARFFIIALAALLVIVLIFPEIGAAVRDGLASLFGDVSARVIGVLAGLVTIAAATLPPLVRTIRGRRGRSAGTGTTSGPEVDAVRAETRKVARRLQALAADRRADSPFARYPGAYFPVEGTPEREKLDAEEDAYIRETYQLYRDELRDEVVTVRNALADIGMTDPELDKLYPHPNTYNKLEALAARLITMADRR